MGRAEKSGYGKTTYRDGSVREGNWEDNQKVGDFKYIDPDGKKYKENWQNNKMQNREPISQGQQQKTKPLGAFVQHTGIGSSSSVPEDSTTSDRKWRDREKAKGKDSGGIGDGW
ncbi:hypothetical protein FACS1894152_7770 [Bacilli bacterium]|nr:hypothetical protein FACS1894152_7770 [Bacilli bacterium]